MQFPRGILLLLSLSLARGSLASSGVILSEIHYHPSAAQGLAEFVEIHNASDAEQDISGWKLTKGVELTFPPGSKLPPRGCIVACENLEAFRAAFGNSSVVAGVYKGKLSSFGEVVRLEDASEKTLASVEYVDGPPWPREADGGGSSLQRVRLTGGANDPSAWIAAKPTPGDFSVRSATPERLSLYKASHEPSEPGPGEDIRVSVHVHAPAKAVPKLIYEVKGTVTSVAMKKDPDAGDGKDPVFTATIPAQPSGTLIRYAIEASDGRGAAIRIPDAHAPTQRFALYVHGKVEASKLPVYSFFFEADALRSLEEDAGSNQLRRAVFVSDGRAFDGVEVRCRGSWARAWPKKSWKVVFPKDHPFQKQRRLNLNSAWHDEAFVREPLAYEVYRAAGVPSMDSKMVRVNVNGGYWGLFAEVEQPKKRYLRKHGLADALLFKAASRSNQADERDLGAPRAYEQHYTLESGEETRHERLARFCGGLEKAADSRSFLERELDLDEYVNYLCASALTQNWDSLNKNHFIAFDSRRTKKWSVLPWDVDRTFGDHWSWRFDVATAPLYLGAERFPGTTGWNRLADKFFSDPSLKKRFHERLLSLLGDTFTEEKLWPRIDALRDSIAGEAERDRQRWGGNADWRAAVDQVKRFVAERRAFLLAQLPGGEPNPPRGLAPADGTTVDANPLVLESSAFSHEDAKAVHRFTRWHVRAADKTWESPAVDETSPKDLLRFSLPRGWLAPRTTYRWRIAHVASSGKISQWSPELSFKTGDFSFEVTRFNLARIFNRDLVANAGDATTDSVDDRDGAFVEDGFDGRRNGNPLAQGLPHDRIVGIHLLGDYSRMNALQLTSLDTDPVRFEVPPAKYAHLRFLVTGGGDSLMPITLELDDGTNERREIPCDDWYDDNPPDGPLQSLRPGVVPILNNLDRIRAGAFKDRNEPAIFEVTIPGSGAKKLKAIILEPGDAKYDPPGRSKFNLFAAAGVRVAP